MSEAKFTKGKWYRHPSGIGCNGAQIAAIFHLGAADVFSKEEVEANTSLMVASPKLYDALELMVRYCNALEERLLDNQITVTDIFLDSPNEQAPEDVAECALAQARGE